MDNISYITLVTSLDVANHSFADVVFDNLHKAFLFDGETQDDLVRFVKEFRNFVEQTSKVTNNNLIASHAFRVKSIIKESISNQNASLVNI